MPLARGAIREQDGADVGCQPLAHPARDGCIESHLVPARSITLGQRARHRLAQDDLRLPAAELVTDRKLEDELDQTVVEEGEPRLERVRHADGVAELEQHRQLACA